MLDNAPLPGFDLTFIVFVDYLYFQNISISAFLLENVLLLPKSWFEVKQLIPLFIEIVLILLVLKRLIGLKHKDQFPGSHFMSDLCQTYATSVIMCMPTLFWGVNYRASDFPRSRKSRGIADLKRNAWNSKFFFFFFFYVSHTWLLALFCPFCCLHTALIVLCLFYCPFTCE